LPSNKLTYAGEKVGEELSRFDFDPFHDVALDPSGCWRWNDNKPEMHQYVRGYFESRKEDG
jgi:hypothetical protein